MSLPGATETCVELEFDFQAFLGLTLTLPGGVELSAQLDPGQLPSLPVMTSKLLGNLNAALTPLMPFFRVLDLAMALTKFAQSVKKALGPPPNPAKIAVALQQVIRAAAKVAALVPPITIVVMLVGFCRVIVATLEALIADLEFAARVQGKLDAARARANLLAEDPTTAAGAAELEISIDCAQVDLDLQIAANAQGLGPVNRLLDLVNALCDLAGLPQLAKIEAGEGASGLLAGLKLAVGALDAFCSALPV